MDLGTMTEGVVELDPMTGRMVLRIQCEGGFEFLDVQKVLEKYKGEEVRFIVSPLSTIAKLAQMVESGGLTADDAMSIKVPEYKPDNNKS